MTHSVLTSSAAPVRPSDPETVVANRHRRVLIVDDDSPMREWIDRVVRRAGYQTAQAVDGQDALHVVDLHGPFDLVLTDLVMPRMSGMQLTARLRRRQPRLKVLYLTGYVDRLFRNRWILEDDEAFLEKPPAADGILEALALLLDGHAPPNSETGHQSA